MKIVTQFNPDLDACMSVWLLKRFGGLREAAIAFVSTGDKLIEGSGDEELIYVDTSGGKYDHHDTSERVCAASLVFKDLGLEHDRALRELVDFAVLVDHGLLMDHQLGRFNLVHVIYGLNRAYASSPDKVVEVAMQVLDALYLYLNDEIQASDAFKTARYFETVWGPGVAVTTSNRQVRYLAHQKGYKVFIYLDPDHGFRGFMAPGGSGVDFSPQLDRLKQIDSEADWFLHSSRELLLCGSAKAPNKRLSTLSLDALISVVAN